MSFWISWHYRYLSLHHLKSQYKWMRFFVLLFFCPTIYHVIGSKLLQSCLKNTAARFCSPQLRSGWTQCWATEEMSFNIMYHVSFCCRPRMSVMHSNQSEVFLPHRCTLSFEPIFFMAQFIRVLVPACPGLALCVAPLEPMSHFHTAGSSPTFNDLPMVIFFSLLFFF